MMELAAALRDSTTRELGKSDIMVEPAELDTVSGLPLHGNIPLQYVLGVDVLPFGRTLSFVGKEGTLKSMLGWYIATIFMRSPGLVNFIDTEHKTNMDQVRGLTKNDTLLESLLFRATVMDINQMNAAMGKYGAEYDKLCPARNVPILYFIDSIGALTSGKAVAAMEKTGDASTAAGYEAARRASDLTEQFRAFVPRFLMGRPAILIFINHIKVKMEEAGGSNFSPGPPEKGSPGGVHKDYMNTATLELTKVKGKTDEAVKAAYATIFIKSLKAALAPTGRKIMVTLISEGPVNRRYPDGDTLGDLESEDDVQRLYADFDWDTALVELLTREGKTTYSKDRKKSVITIQGTPNKRKCPELGITDVVTDAELGAAIHGNPEMVKALQDVLGIYRKPKPQ